MNKFRLNLIKAFSVLFAVCIGFAITSMPAKAEDANFSVTQGASIRNASNGQIGLQFESSVNDAWLEGKTVKQFGTLIYPTANEIESYDNKTLSNIVDELDAVKIIRSENTSGNFNASIVYDRQSVIDGIAGKVTTVSDELVNSVLKNLYNKEFSARTYAILNDDSVVYTNAHSNSMYRTAIRTYALGGENETLALNYFESASSVEANIYGNDLALTTNTATTFSSDAIVILNDKVLTKQADYNVENGTIVLTYSAVQALEGTNHTFYIIDNDENVDINNDKDWLDVLTVVNAKLLPIEGIQVNLIDGKEYDSTQNASEYLEFKYVYDNGTDTGLVSTELYSLNEDNITSVTVNGNTVTITVTVTVYNQPYETTYTVTIDETPKTVSDFLDATSVVEGSQFTLTGIVAGFATNIDQNEVILTDGTNFVSVVGLGGGNVVSGSYYLNGVDVGYEISLPVERYTSDSGANTGKVYAKFVGVDETAVSVISNKKENITLPAVSEVISSTSALETFLQGGNQYKLVTLKAEMNFVMDNDYPLYDFWFYDTQATSYDEIKVNGLIPTFSNVATQITVGKTFGELALDNADATSQDFSEPHNVIKEITALYLGGNATHAQFLLLNNSSVGNPTPIVSGYELVAPDKVYYTEEEIKGGLDLTGCTIIKKYDIKSNEYISVVDNNDVEIKYPDTYVVGVNTIKVKFETQELTFNIEVQGKAIDKIEVNEEDYAEYTQLSHRDSISNVSFENIYATITYTDETTEPLQLSSTMVTNPEDWNVGEVTYKLTHEGFEFDLVINYENKAYSVSQFLEGTGLTVGTAYDVHGLVAKTIYSNTSDEFLLKDIETNNVISILDSEMVNSSLDFKDTIAIGDEVIVNLELTKSNTSSSKIDGNDGKIFGSAIDNATFKSNLLILSNNNTIEFNLDEVTTTITSKTELTDFLVNNGEDSDTYTFKNFYQIVKLDGAKFSYRTSKQALLYFGDNITDETDTKYDKWFISYDITTSKKYISKSGTLNGALASSVTGSSLTIANGKFATAPNHDIYAMFIGGTTTYLKFAILDKNWIVPKA